MSQYQDDHTRIRVTDCDIGVTGLKQAIQEIAESHADRSEAEIASALLERLSSRNYIASSARSDYGKAFVREFRKFLGQPYQEEADGAISVVILGPGCAQCNHLEQLVMRALEELGLPASPEHITDVKEMAKYGFVSTPALIINGKIVAKGTVPNINKIKEWLKQARPSQTS
ncbi:MAG: thioredoxin family protein [Deltaproteobacteria bacterium]|nr:thioredoxin family protein [Deltaproteobacteria bacterium]